MHDYYAARAPEYDAVYLKPERQPDLRAIEAWLPGRFANRSVLEVACGTGHWTRLLAPAAARMLAVDAANETLEIARARVAGDTVRFVLGDAYELPADGAPFDGAFAGFWWSHVPLERLAAFLAGLHARLRPGARVVFLDNRYVAGSSTPVSDTDANGNTYQVRRLRDGSAHRVLKNFPSRQAAIDAVARNAAEVAYREWDYFWALDYTLKA